MTLLERVKANLILEHSADDALLETYIAAAVSYAESYQHISAGWYAETHDAAHHRTGRHHAVVPFLRIQGRQHGRLFCRQRSSGAAGMEHGKPAAPA